MHPRPEFVVSLTDQLDAKLKAHLDPGDGDEDLAFATWSPSTGNSRFTAVLHDVILPEPGDRERHGNVHLNHPYLERAAALARSQGRGLALLHSHPGARLWQRLSPDDATTEGVRIAPYAASVTGLPFVGLTLATETGVWSARRWLRRPRAGKPSFYEPDSAMAVKVVGKRLNYYPSPQAPVPEIGEELLRTSVVLGAEAQGVVARMRFGVVGLGSVGSIISESLARLGATNVVLFDFDDIKPHNRDRTLNAASGDVGKNKARVAAAAAKLAATVPGFEVAVVDESIVKPAAFQRLLDCDVVFSCVDRPWPRHVLNAAAYAHLIPVIDGGIIVRFREGRFDGMDWRTQTAGPNRACLACTGGYAMHLVGVERSGLLEDPTYVNGMPESERPRSENILPLSLGLAGQELVQLVHLLAGFKGFDDVGLQSWHYSPPFLDSTPKQCAVGCGFPPMTAIGDAMPTVTAEPLPKETSS